MTPLHPPLDVLGSFLPFQPCEDGTATDVQLSTFQVMDAGVAATHCEDVWRLFRGANVRVAVIDTGHTDHPDILPNVVGTQGDADAAGHGTHVAGIIGAVDNGFGVVGVAPGCCLLLYQAIPGDAASIAAALTQAVADKADLVNMSLGAYDDMPGVHAAVQAAYAAGVVLVAAAGNDPTRVSYPAAYPEVIAVSALDGSTNQRASFAPLVPNHIAFPGVNILSCWLGGQYARLSGTSQACPLLTGEIALMLGMMKPTRDVVQETVRRELVRLAGKHADLLYFPTLESLCPRN